MADSMNFIKSKWIIIGSDEILKHRIIKRSIHHIIDGGGILWLRYMTQEQSDPDWAFGIKDNKMWKSLKESVPNFKRLTDDYNPEKHCLIFLSIRRSNDRMYGQLVRVNYNQQEQPLQSPEEIAAIYNRDITDEGVSNGSGETIWTFCL